MRAIGHPGRDTPEECVILVLSHDNDPVADQGERLLRARGAAVVRFEPARFPDEATLALSWRARGRHRRTLRLDGREVDLSQVDAVWHRRVNPPNPRRIRDAAARRFAVRESETLLWQLYLELDAPFVPAPLPVLRAGQDKLRQLSLAAELGFEIPPTLLTNDPDELLAFHREHDGRLIAKLLTQKSMEESRLSNEYIRFTEPVTWRDIAAYRSARLCPVFAQAYVPKDVELRVTVVGDRVFPVEIHSQAIHHTRHDWRKYAHAGAPYFPHELPAPVAEQCRAITRALDLRYGALDLVLTPDGRYVFLEINPAGEYHWVEQRTGLPITEAIAELLVSLARRHRAAEVS